MGLYEEPRELPPVAAFSKLDSPEEPDGSVLGAAFRQENTVVSAVREGLSTGFGRKLPFVPRPKSKYSAWQDIEGTQYEEYWDTFAGATSFMETQRLKTKIDEEQRDRRILGNAGGKGIAAQLLAGFVDAPTAVPGLQAVRGATKGYSIGRNAYRSSVTAMSEAAAVELALQSIQETRTKEESAAAIGGSVVLGLALGGGVGAFMRTADAPSSLNAVERGQGLDAGLYDAEGRNLSAATVDSVELTADDFQLPTAVANQVADFTPSALSFTDTFRQASSVKAKQLGAELLTDAYSFQGKGRLGPSAESQFDVEYGQAAIAQRSAFDTAFLDLRKTDAKGTTRSEMSEAIAMALRRGDVSDIPEVARAAQELRAKVIDPLKDKAIRAGLLPEDVAPTGARSYFPRLWDASKIDARAAEFKSRLERQFSADARAAREAGADGFDLTDVELDGYARLDAESVYDTLTGAGEATNGLFVSVKARGPLKERTLNVRDVDFEDFLVNDAEFALDRYARILSAEIAMKERFGDVTLRPQIEAVRAEYGDLIANAKSEKIAGKLAKERNRVIDRVEAARDLMRGTYQLGERGRVPYRVLQSLMSYNFIRLLGDVVVSSLGDIARLSMTHGMRNVVEGAVVPLVRNLKETRMTAIQAKEWAGISEVMLATRLMKIADITDPYSARTPLENTLATMSGMAGKYSGILHWNDAMKSMAVLSFTNRVRRLKNSKADVRFLDRVGLSKDIADRARAQMKEHGEDGAGAFDPHIERWTDNEAQALFVRAMRADADTTVVTPGIGDKVPVAEHHYWLKPALQFRSFTLAAHRRILIAGLQEDQTRFLMNAASMMAMGMMVYQAKALTSGRETSDNPGVWIAEGIDRAGIVPLFMEMSNMLEAVNGPGAFYMLGNLLGEDPEMASRFASRNVGGALAGPTAGLLGDLKNIAQSMFIGLTDGEPGKLSGVTEGTIGSAKRTLPFGNHPAIRPYLNLYAVPALKDAIP